MSRVKWHAHAGVVGVGVGGWGEGPTAATPISMSTLIQKQVWPLAPRLPSALPTHPSAASRRR